MSDETDTKEIAPVAEETKPTEESVINPINVINVPEKKKRAVTEKRKLQLEMARKAKKEQSISKAKQLKDAGDEKVVTKPVPHYFDVYSDDEDEDSSSYLTVKNLFKAVALVAVLVGGYSIYSGKSDSVKEVVQTVVKKDISNVAEQVPDLNSSALYNFE